MKSTYNQKLSDVVLSQDEIDRIENLTETQRQQMNSEMLQLLARSKSLSTIKTHDMDWLGACSMVLLIAAVIFVGILLR
jgi:ABC-type transport system involved in cytochrome bd biosynthesis fused ATPase/permease subunit